MGFFKKLFGSKKAQSPEVDITPQKAEALTSLLSNYDKLMFVNLESKYRHQPIVLRRSSELDRITLGEIIEEVLQIKPDSLQSLAVVERDTMLYGINTYKIDNNSEIAKFDLFGCILKNKYEGHYTQGMSNDATLIIKANSKEIALNISSLGGSPEMKYIRIVLLSPDNKEMDDKRTTQSKNLPFVSSFVLSFVEDGHENSLEFYERIEKSLMAKQQKGEKIDDIEREMLHGQQEFMGLGYFGYGHSLYEQSQYYDAYSILHRAYNYLKLDFHNVPDEIKPLFYEICNIIGVCLSKLGREEEAYFFFHLNKEVGKVEYYTNYIDSLSNLGNASAMWYAKNTMQRIYADVYGQNYDNWPKEAKEFSYKISSNLIKYKQAFDSKLKERFIIDTKITIGELLKSLFGTEWYDILPNMAIFDQIEGQFVDAIEGKDKIFNYLLNLENNFDKIFVLSLTHSKNESKDNGDQSSLANFATLIIVTHKIKSDKNANLMRVDIVRGNFPNDDDRREPTNSNVPLFTSLVLGTCSDNTFGATKEECLKCFQFAESLHGQSRFLEALKLYRWTFENASNMMKTDMGRTYDSDDKYILGLFFESAFRTGFCLMELGAMEAASYYLRQAAESNMYEHSQEYINCLVNTRAPIALDVINGEISRTTKPKSESDIGKWNYHKAFLKRRKAYVLIDMKLLDEAEKLLREMVDDPLCKNFAVGELRYLSRIR